MWTSIRRRKNDGIAITLSLMAISLLIACGPSQEVRERITLAVSDDATEANISEGYAVDLPPDVREFYRSRDGDPLWINGRGLNARGRAALDALRKSQTEGLNPERYAIPMIESLADSAADGDDETRADRLRDIELLLTSRYLLHLEDLAIGAVEPQLSLPDSAWRRQRLESIASGEDPNEATSSLVPLAPEYEQLRAALARYQAIADEGGWETVPAGEGEAAIQAVRNRLIAERDTVESALSSEPIGPVGSMDEKLEQAISHFQTRHAIEATGALNERTRQAMNVPVDERLHSLRVTMDRWRALPREFGELYVFVNIPSYELRVIEGENDILEMKVVVGKDVHPTPTMSDTMEYVVVNPYWNVPESILEAEILPAVRKDRNYLTKQNMEVVDRDGDSPQVIDMKSVDFDGEEFPYQVRQRPGPGNALGRVKFMFPNKQNIYLHDTPADALFDRNDRAFSHGCVRVEKPMELADLILSKASDVTPEQFRAILAGGEEKHIRLDRGIPVYLAYLTAWVDDEAGVRFYPDLYDRDSAVSEVARARLAPAPAPVRRRIVSS